MSEPYDLDESDDPDELTARPHLRQWPKRELRREVKRLRKEVSSLQFALSFGREKREEAARRIELLTEQKSSIAARNTSLRSALLNTQRLLESAQHELNRVLGPRDQGGIDGTDRPTTTVRRRAHRRTPGAPVDPNIAG